MNRVAYRLRRAAALLAFLLPISLWLTACQTKDAFTTSPSRAENAGEWKVEKQVDRITNQPVSSAFVMTRASNSMVDNPKSGQLQLLCFDKQPVVRFAFEFKIGAEQNSEFGYRFDDKAGHDNIAARILKGNNVAVIEDRAAVQRFVEELASSRTLFVRVRSLNMGRTAAEFKVEQAQQAIDAAYANCPVGPSGTPRSSRAS